MNGTHWLIRRKNRSCEEVIYMGADVAQLVEQHTRNVQVVGSIPTIGSLNYKKM